MQKQIEKFLGNLYQKPIQDIRPGDSVVVHFRLKEGKEDKLFNFKGLVIARKHGKETGATITVRRVISGVGVERIFPLHSPLIEKIAIEKRGKTRRAKLYFVRKAKSAKVRLKLKNKEFSEAVAVEEEPQKIEEAVSEPQTEEKPETQAEENTEKKEENPEASQENK